MYHYRYLAAARVGSAGAFAITKCLSHGDDGGSTVEEMRTSIYLHDQQVEMQYKPDNKGDWSNAWPAIFVFIRLFKFIVLYIIYCIVVSALPQFVLTHRPDYSHELFYELERIERRQFCPIDLS